jgi:hypothetical protein
MLGIAYHKGGCNNESRAVHGRPVQITVPGLFGWGVARARRSPCAAGLQPPTSEFTHPQRTYACGAGKRRTASNEPRIEAMKTAIGGRGAQAQGVSKPPISTHTQTGRIAAGFENKA